MGRRTGAGTAADAGTRRGAQGRAAEAGWFQVKGAPRWAALCTGRGVGERVKQYALTRNGYGWGANRKEGEMKIQTW